MYIESVISFFIWRRNKFEKKQVDKGDSAIKQTTGNKKVRKAFSAEE